MKLLFDNINRLINDVSTVILWQNSIFTECEKEFICSQFTNDKLVFAGDGHNKGIPIALNYAIKYMNHHGYDYLLTMDQDSLWVNLHQYVSFVNNQNKNMIYGPRVLANTSIEEIKSIPLQTKEVGFVITSGMLCHKDVISKIGLFNENLFIDAVDEEYCYRARQFGIKSAQVQGTYLRQQFGNSKRVSFLGKKTLVSNYTAFRYFYIVRNHIYLIRSDLLSKKEKRLVFINYVRAPIIKSILFEDNKIDKFKAIICGIIAGLKMAKGVNNVKIEGH